MPEKRDVQLLHRKRHWVFDLDGTLTQPVHDFAHIRQELGIPPGQDILGALAARSPAEQRRAHGRLDELERHYAAQASPAEGVTECLELLCQRGCRLGILTRNTRELALLSLQAIGLDHFFSSEVVLGRDESEPKPSPDGIHFLLHFWGGAREDAVMVGDYHYDLLCGRAARVFTVHVSDREPAWPEDTDLRVSSLSELYRLLV